MSEVALGDRLIPGDLTHNVIILSGWLGRVAAPLMVLICLIPVLGAGLIFSAPGFAVAVFAAATLTDALLLVALPRLGLSFGPVQGPLVVFTLGRHLLALPLALLPPGWDVGCLLGLQALLTACSLWGHLVEPFRVRVTRVRAPILKQRPAGPVRIVVLTDLHMERFTRRERRVLDVVDELAPELVLFGGDLLNLSYVRDERAKVDALSFMERLLVCFPLRVVLGNPTVEVREVVRPFWDTLGVTPMDASAERMILHGARLRLYGLPASVSLKKDGERLKSLLAKYPPASDETAVLLYHLPDLAGSTSDIDLYLAGHTHGGQIRMPLVGALFTASRAARRLAMGTHQLGTTMLHTSRGLGMEGAGAPRMRFLCPPEVTLVELTFAEDAT